MGDAEEEFNEAITGLYIFFSMASVLIFPPALVETTAALPVGTATESVRLDHQWLFFMPSLFAGVPGRRPTVRHEGSYLVSSD